MPSSLRLGVFCLRQLPQWHRASRSPQLSERFGRCHRWHLGTSASHSHRRGRRVGFLLRRKRPQRGGLRPRHTAWCTPRFRHAFAWPGSCRPPRVWPHLNSPKPSGFQPLLPLRAIHCNVLPSLRFSRHCRQQKAKFNHRQCVGCCQDGARRLTLRQRKS